MLATNSHSYGENHTVYAAYANGFSEKVSLTPSLEPSSSMEIVSRTRAPLWHITAEQEMREMITSQMWAFGKAMSSPELNPMSSTNATLEKKILNPNSSNA